VFTYLSLVTLPPAFAALTVFAATGRLPSLLAPIARLGHAVHGTVQPRALPDGLPAGRAAVTTLLYHGLIVARTAPPPEPAPQAAEPGPGQGVEPTSPLPSWSPSPSPSPAPDEPRAEARPPVRPVTDTPTAPGALVYDTPVLTGTAAPVVVVAPLEPPPLVVPPGEPVGLVIPPLEPPLLVVPPGEPVELSSQPEPPGVVIPPLEPPVVLSPPAEQAAEGGGLALGQLAHAGGIGANGFGNGLGRTVGPAAPYATDGWTDHGEPAHGAENAWGPTTLVIDPGDDVPDNDGSVTADDRHGSSSNAHGAADDPHENGSDVADSPHGNGEAEVTAHAGGDMPADDSSATRGNGNADGNSGDSSNGNGNSANSNNTADPGASGNRDASNGSHSKKPKP
jgi:hypothetical protein